MNLMVEMCLNLTIYRALQILHINWNQIIGFWMREKYIIFRIISCISENYCWKTKLKSSESSHINFYFYLTLFPRFQNNFQKCEIPKKELTNLNTRMTTLKLSRKKCIKLTHKFDAIYQIDVKCKMLKPNKMYLNSLRKKRVFKKNTEQRMENGVKMECMSTGINLNVILSGTTFYHFICCNSINPTTLFINGHLSKIPSDLKYSKENDEQC